MKKPIPYKEPEKRKLIFKNKKIQNICLVCIFAFVSVLIAVLATVILSVVLNVSAWIMSLIAGIFLCFTSFVIGKKFIV